MPSTPTEYKSDSDDDWAAEQEGMRALYECRHPLEWLMPSTTTEYKFDSEDHWTFEEERRKAMELHRWHQQLAANGNCVECWCCRSRPLTSTRYKFDSVLPVLFEENWLDHFEYARVLVATCRPEDARRVERLWWEYFAATVEATEDHKNTASCQCGKCRCFLEDTTLMKRISGYRRTK